MITDLSGRRFGILGLGRSGVGAAGLIKRLGGNALISDSKPAESFGSLPYTLRARGVEVETGSHARLLTEDYDVLIVSPGAMVKQEWQAQLGKRGTQIWSELELASQCYDGRWIGVTGSNGKTTTVTLIRGILEHAGLRVDAVGNIGVAWSERLPSTDVDLFVVEVSSFQLEFTQTARPNICVLLNVLENHLDRHGDLETYGQLKLKLAANQGPSDFVILNGDDHFLMRNAHTLKAAPITFSKDSSADWIVRDGHVASATGQIILSHDEWELVGTHNLLNAAAAAAAASCLGISETDIHTALTRAVAVEHRIEWVRTLDGVHFFNDSKSTNLIATLTALDAIDGPVILLFGGRPKRESFAPLANLIGNNIREIVVFGEAREKVSKDVPETSVHFCDDLESALMHARTVMHPGDTILLSPGCASYDQFENYEQRGTLFKKLVYEL